MWLDSHQSILGWLGLLSLLMMAATLLAAPLIIVRLPSRFLVEENDGAAQIPFPWRWPYLFVKNVLGILLVLAGLAMLVLPGQGLLTLVIGLALLNLPGKRRLIRRLIGQPRVRRTINRLRTKFHKKPLEAPADLND
jgi:MFS family permease